MSTCSPEKIQATSRGFLSPCTPCFVDAVKLTLKHCSNHVLLAITKQIRATKRGRRKKTELGFPFPNESYQIKLSRNVTNNKALIIYTYFELTHNQRK